MNLVAAIVFLVALDKDIHECRNSTWVEMKGEMEPKSIAVDGNEKLWGLSQSGRVIFWENNRWKSLDESTVTTFLTVSQDGTPYIIGPGSLVNKRVGNRWEPIPDMKNVKAMAIDGADNLWVMDTSKNIWFSYAGKWYPYPGTDGATAMAVSRDSDVYIIGAGSKVFRGTMTGWKEIPNALALDIAVDSTGTLWAVGLDNRIWYLDENEVWRHYGGAMKGTEIAVF